MMQRSIVVLAVAVALCALATTPLALAAPGNGQAHGNDPGAHSGAGGGSSSPGDAPGEPGPRQGPSESGAGSQGEPNRGPQGAPAEARHDAPSTPASARQAEANPRADNGALHASGNAEPLAELAGTGAVPNERDAGQGQSLSQAQGHPVGVDRATAPAGPVNASRVAHATVEPALTVTQDASGVTLAWSLPSNSTHGELWRAEGQGWVLVAALHEPTGTFADLEAPVGAVYRMTWSSEGAGAVGLRVDSVPLSAALEDHGQEMDLGAWLLSLLFGGVVLVGLLRAPRTSDLPAAPIRGDDLLVAALRHRGDKERDALHRLNEAGLRTVDELRGIDADALAFWGRVSPAQVRAWKEELERMPSMPVPAASTGDLAQRETVAALTNLATTLPLDEPQSTEALDDASASGANSAEVFAWAAPSREHVPSSVRVATRPKRIWLRAAAGDEPGRVDSGSA